jgi:NADH:ubiquinone oxidoreductase subunit 6 (subunit J)
MKVDKVVRKETFHIAVGILVCSAITQILFALFGKFSLAVLLGSIYGGIVALLNFFLMGLTVQSVTKIEDTNMAKKKMQFSYSVRQLGLMLLVGGGMYIAVNIGVFHWLPILLAVFYPRLTIVFVGLFNKEWRSKRGDII